MTNTVLLITGIRVITHSDSNGYYPVSGVDMSNDMLVFTITGCEYAYVILSTGPDGSGNYYVIVIGGDGNVKLAFR